MPLLIPSLPLIQPSGLLGLLSMPGTLLLYTAPSGWNALFLWHLPAWLASFRSLLKRCSVGFCGAGDRTYKVLHVLAECSTTELRQVASWTFAHCNDGNAPWGALYTSPQFSCKALTVSYSLLVTVFLQSTDCQLQFPCYSVLFVRIFGPISPHSSAHCVLSNVLFSVTVSEA